MSSFLTPESHPKVILRDSPFIVIRIDQLSLGRLKIDQDFPAKLKCDSVELLSVFTAGTLKKTRERIKALQG
jgi:hypothetical protein